MNALFIALRFVGYLFLFGIAYYHSHDFHWFGWFVSFAAISWGTWDAWKKPNEERRKMRYGILLECFLISCWTATIHNGILLFAFLSPLARASIHLRLTDRGFVFLYACLVATASWIWMPGTEIIVPLSTFVFVVAYSSVIGSLMNERARSRQLMALSDFEKEQRVRDHERVRISRRLHDTMGQYWVAVIRMIDAAEAVDGAGKMDCIRQARQAAEQGLQEMRKIVRNGNDGTQTPEQWFAFALSSIKRLKKIAHLSIECDYNEINWERFRHPYEAGELVARTILESISNAIRHGHATKISVSILDKDLEFTMLIKDNGSGFRHEKSTHIPQGIGLKSLTEFAKTVGGKISIDSGSKKGTQIQLIIFH